MATCVTPEHLFVLVILGVGAYVLLFIYNLVFSSKAFSESINDFLAGLGFVVALLTFIYTRMQANQQMMIKYHEKYFSNEMGEYLRIVSGFEKGTVDIVDESKALRYIGTDEAKDRGLSKEEKDLSEAKAKAKAIDIEEWRCSCGDSLEINIARRKIKEYFHVLYDLYKNGYINTDELRTLCDKGGIVLLFRVVEPMEAAKNKKYDWRQFKELYDIVEDIYKKQIAMDGFPSDETEKKKASQGQSIGTLTIEGNYSLSVQGLPLDNVILPAMAGDKACQK